MQGVEMVGQKEK